MMLTYRGRRIPSWRIAATLALIAALFSALIWID